MNGHTNGAAHLVGDIRPQEFRHRIETPSLRGINIQRLFGSQRALRSVEDFTEFEQRDGRLMTLEDTVESFNLILGTKLSAEEKQDLVAFLRVL